MLSTPPGQPSTPIRLPGASAAPTTSRCPPRPRGEAEGSEGEDETMATIGYERKEAMAARLLATADSIGEAANFVDELARDELAIVQAEDVACDTILIAGALVGRAMRTLAMRLDRAAAVKHAKDN